MALRLLKKQRVLKPKEYAHVFDRSNDRSNNSQLKSNWLALHLAQAQLLVQTRELTETTDLDSPLEDETPVKNSARLGLVISKRYAPRAVDRNLVKRIIREHFRRQAEGLPSLDYVFRLKQKPQAHSRLALKTQLHHQVEKLFKEINANSQKARARTFSASSSTGVG